MSVILYQHIDYRGQHKHIIGRNEDNLHRDGWGDRVSSIQVLGGVWDFFEHINGGGRRVRLGPGSYRWVENVGIRNDSLSSIRRVWGGGLMTTPGIILFEHINFRGAHKHIVGRSESNLHTDGWGDRVSSMIITSGRWRICQHVNFGGWSFVLGPGIYPWVGDLGIPNDQISSIRREPDVAAALRSFETILYQHIDFGGEHKHLICRGESSLHVDGWGDRVSSFQVLRGDQWQFFQHVGYQGASIRRGPGSYRWVVDEGLANDVLSSVRANQIPVFVQIIQGAAPDLPRDFNWGNQTFNQYDMGIWELGRGTVTRNDLLDLDQPTCFLNQAPTAEEDALFDVSRRRFPSDIIAYYLRSTSLGVRGCAAFPAGRPGVVVCDSATRYTLAHELGHVLGLFHVTDQTNLMNNGTAGITTHPPVLSTTQRATVRASQFLV